MVNNQSVTPAINPFRAPSIVRPPSFTKRADRIRKLLPVPGATLVWGERRMGKTSCLAAALDTHRERGGMGLLADFSTASTLADCSNRLLAAAGASGLPTPGLEAGSRAAPLEAQRQTLERVLATLDGQAAARGATLAVVLDEFQEIHRFGGESAEWHLRGVLQQLGHTSWVLAGSRTHLIERMLAKDRAFHDVHERIEFDPIEPGQFAQWLEDRMLIGGVRARGMGVRLIDLAGPRTGDVVELARKAFDVAWPSGVLDEALLGLAFDELVSEGEDLAAPFWGSLTAHQQNLLRAVAAGERQLTSQDTRARYALRSGAAASKALKEFVEAGRLARLPEGGGYAFDSPYLRGWVQRNALRDLGFGVRTKDAPG